MQCPKCQRENEPTYRFCIFCGNPLPTSEAQERSEVAENPLVDDTILGIADSSQKNVPKHQIEVEMDYAGFRRRFVASIIDAIILGVLLLIIGWLVYAVLSQLRSYVDAQDVFLAYFVWLPASIIYFIGFWIWRGQTPGKMAMGVRIVRTDGSPAGFGRVTLRCIALIAPAITILIGSTWVVHFVLDIRPAVRLVVDFLFLPLVILLPYFLAITHDSKKQGLHDKIAKTYVVKTNPTRSFESPGKKTVDNDS